MSHQDGGREAELAEVKINTEQEWPLPFTAIASFMEGKSIQKLQNLGGVETIAVALRTNLKDGISVEEHSNDFVRRYALYPFCQATN